MGRHHVGDGSYQNIKDNRSEGTDWFQVAKGQEAWRDFVNTVRHVGFHKKRETPLQDER
jgi:hypothetical protein